MAGHWPSLVQATPLVLQVPFAGGHWPSAKQEAAETEHWPGSVGQLPSFWQMTLVIEQDPEAMH